MSFTRIYASLIVIFGFAIFVYFGGGNVIPAIAALAVAFLVWKLLTYFGNSMEHSTVANVEAIRLQAALATQEKFKGFADHVGANAVEKARRESKFCDQIGKMSLQKGDAQISAAKNAQNQTLKERMEFAQRRQNYLAGQVLDITEAELVSAQLVERQRIEEQQKSTERELDRKQKEVIQLNTKLAEEVELAKKKAILKLKSSNF